MKATMRRFVTMLEIAHKCLDPQVLADGRYSQASGFTLIQAKLSHLPISLSSLPDQSPPFIAPSPLPVAPMAPYGQLVKAFIEEIPEDDLVDIIGTKRSSTLFYSDDFRLDVTGVSAKVKQTLLVTLALTLF
jgi:hypothetical protein